MSGRRLRNCTACLQRHYAPSGARCPYKPGDCIPPDLLPDQDIERQGQELSDSDPFTEDEGDDSEPRAQLVISYTGSEFELPSGQTEPTPSTSKEPDHGPVSLQSLADATSQRVRHLEEERARMVATQESLQQQQRTLQQELDAIKRQWNPAPLQDNADVRSRQPHTQMYPSLTDMESELARSRASTPASSQRTTGPLQPHATGSQTDGVSQLFPQGAPQALYPVLQPVNTYADQSHHFVIQAQPGPSAFTPVAPTLSLHPPVPRQPQPGAPTQPTPQAIGGLSAMRAPPPRGVPIQGGLPQPQAQQQTTLTDLRTDRSLMDRAALLVAQNTQEQAEQGKHPKSGLKRDNTEQVCRVIPWPHEHVIRQAGKADTYDSLTLSEFASGSMRILALQPDLPPLVYGMAVYFGDLYDDITDTDGSLSDSRTGWFYKTWRMATRITLTSPTYG